MSEYLSMSPEMVRQQANSFHDAAQALSDVSGSWGTMLEPDALGENYKTIAGDIIKGFDHVTAVVKNWSAACGAFGDALTQSADVVQYTDAQFAGDIGKVAFDSAGDLTSGGK